VESLDEIKKFTEIREEDSAFEGISPFSSPVQGDQEKGDHSGGKVGESCS